MILEDNDDPTSDIDYLLSPPDDAFALPSRQTIYLNRDFIKQGQVKVKLEDITPFQVFMWDNRFMRDLSFNRDNIAPITEEYRRKAYSEIDYFRRRCWTRINLETKQMLTQEVKRAFRDDANNNIVQWIEGVHLLNDHYDKTKDASLAYSCLYGPAFSGNWAKIAQTSMMRSYNIDYRTWDLTDKPCPNGFLSHMYSATKGNHVKKIKFISASLGRQPGGITVPASGAQRSNPKYKLSANAVELDRDPNYLHVQSIVEKLTEMEKGGNVRPTIGDVKKLLYNLKRSNLLMCTKLAFVNQQGTNLRQEGTRCETEDSVSNQAAGISQSSHGGNSDDDDCSVPSVQDDNHTSTSLVLDPVDEYLVENDDLMGTDDRLDSEVFAPEADHQSKVRDRHITFYSDENFSKTLWMFLPLLSPTELLHFQWSVQYLRDTHYFCSEISAGSETAASRSISTR